MSGRSLVLGLLACVMLASGLSAPPAVVAAGRDRGLERVLGDAYDDAEAERIVRAFRAAVRGGVREREAADLLEACVEGGFSAEQLARVLSLAAQLALQDLPVEAFAAKIQEGTAKGVPAERVLQAAEARALNLNQARSIVNAAVLDGLEVRDRDELVDEVAGALEAGRTAAEVSEILRRAEAEGLDDRDLRRELLR